MDAPNAGHTGKCRERREVWRQLFNPNEVHTSFPLRALAEGRRQQDTDERGGGAEWGRSKK